MMEETTPNIETQQQETKWYVLRVVSGKERKVKEYLDKEISRGGWSEVVKQVFLPVEKVYKVQGGKKVMRERNYYPGYVMIEIVDGKLSDERISGVPKVYAQGQGGLLDIQLHPEYEKNGWIYLTYSKPGPGGGGTTLARAKLNGNAFTDFQDLFSAETKCAQS